MFRDTTTAKLATEAGPIAYKTRNNRNKANYSKNNFQDIWNQFDEIPHTTGQESSHGMPSAPKQAAFANAQSAYRSGSRDANKALGIKDKKMSDAIQEAFETNQDIGTSSTPEPAFTNPQGSKYAKDLSGVVSPMPKPPSVSNPLKSKSMQGASAATDPRTEKPPGMNLQHALSEENTTSNSQSSFASPQQRMQGNPV